MMDTQIFDERSMILSEILYASCTKTGPQLQIKVLCAEMTVMKALRQIPPVNDVLECEELSRFGPVLNQPFVSRLLNTLLVETRARLRAENSEASSEPSREELTRDIALELYDRIELFLTPSLTRVINATGVVLHTNLGRAPLPAAAIDRLREVSVGYSNLEFNLEDGTRGKRDDHVVGLINELLGSESALVVNNNAAAVLLVLNSLADGGEVLASRGEEVEIGGSFRIPEVMVKSGARLHEIGTTNRTRIEDYGAGVSPETRLLLRVHPSNFRVIGFTERPSLNDFVELGRSSGIPTYEDIGSGCLADMLNAAITDEPLPKESIEAGVDVISFSGDKLMGGPQAGIVAGRKALIDRIRQNPLFRALRVDKLTLSVLETVLLMHLRGDSSDIPTLGMLGADESELRNRSEAMARRTGNPAVTPISLKSVVGGGSVPAVEIPSWGIALSPGQISATEMEIRFRRAKTPVIVRIEDDRVLLDLRTVFRNEEDGLLDVIAEIMGR
jgi:L-seryl-tRNA(Ser) seleniumtransferase